MNDAEKREKVIRGLECCLSPNDHENCPYDGIGKTYSHCLKQLVTDAFALLKEQEPRVMTLDEVHEDHDRVVWIECDASKTLNIGQYRGQVYYHNSRVGKWERFVTISFSDDYLYRKSDKYGKTWRCWTSYPTDKERQDTKWEEHNG